jgi:hypothetical protein
MIVSARPQRPATPKAAAVEAAPVLVALVAQPALEAALAPLVLPAPLAQQVRLALEVAGRWTLAVPAEAEPTDVSPYTLSDLQRSL